MAFGAILSLFLISSCSDPSAVGIELAPGNNEIGVFFEEFELPAEMVLLDSFNTTNQNRLVVGEEVDPFFGKTSATGYSRMSIKADATRPELDAILDSIYFTVNVLNISGADLDEPKHFSIHRLTEPIQDTLYYNFDELSYGENPISTGEIVFGEETDTLANFQVDEEFAEEIFSKLQLGAEFNDLFSFRDYFPGIAVKGKEDENSSIIIGLGTSTAIKLYYRNDESDTVSTLYTISTESSRNFNGIKSDRSGTPTEAITEYQKSYDVGPLVGMKSGLGMVIKLDTSPFDAFLDTLSGVIFNQVALEVGEIEDPIEGMVPTPYFTAFFTDPSNHFLENTNGNYYTVQADGRPQVIADSESNTNEPEVQYPAQFSYNSDNKLYGQSIASYVNAISRGDLVRKDWILYGGYISNKRRQGDNSDPFAYSLSQMIVDKSKIKVKVIYSRSR